MKTSTHSGLSLRIEQLIRDHIAACRREAQDAIERAFASAYLPLLGKTPVKTVMGSSASRKTSRRRTRQELYEMGESLYRAICANPGETMAVLARHLGVAASDLHRPMTQLREARRIKSAGQRHLTRYFPMSDAQATAA
jgi:hypothetical protein